MKSISEFSKQQYELVKGSRKVLFDYCETVTNGDFISQIPSFGRRGSMRNLLVHIANTYQYWIANLSMRQNIPYYRYEAHENIMDVVELFDSIDSFMDEFTSTIDSETQIEYEIDGVINIANSFKLFTHVITHEYHHKGQILSISRHLGYTPIDTDIMR